MALVNHHPGNGRKRDMISRILVLSTLVCFLLTGCTGNADWMRGIQLGSNPQHDWTKQLIHIRDLASRQDAESMVLCVTGKPVAVLFYNPSCEPCERLAPTMVSLSREYAGRVRFFKVEAPAGETLRSDWSVVGDPTVLVFREGKLCDRILGRHEMNRYEESLSAALSGESTPCPPGLQKQDGPEGCRCSQPTDPSSF
jgi:thioredoxin